jgi:hypothetical protein
MADELAELLLRITAESGDAERDLTGFAATLEGVGALTEKPEVRVDVEGVEKIVALQGLLDTLNDAKIEPHISEAFEKRLKNVSEELLSIGKAQAPGQKNIEQILENAAAGAPRDIAPGGGVLLDPRPLNEAEQALQDLTGALHEFEGAKDAVIINPQPTKDFADALEATARAAEDAHGKQVSLAEALERTAAAAATPQLSEQGPSGAVAFNTTAVEAFREELHGLSDDSSTTGSKLRRLEADMGDLVDVIPGDQQTGGLTKFLGALGSLKLPSGAFSGLSGAFESMNKSVGHVSTNIGPFGARLGLVSGAIIVLVGVIAVNLVGALGALAASFAFAAAAAGAAAIAIIGAFGPLVAVAIPAVLALGKVLKVLQTEQQEAATASADKAQADIAARHAAEQHADGIRALHDALRSQEDAERSLTEAVQNEKDARVKAYDEWQDAIEATSDARLSLERSELSADQADLGLKQAQFDLKKFRSDLGLTGDEFTKMFDKFTNVDFDYSAASVGSGLKEAGVTEEEKALKLQGLILNVRDARLREKEATDGVSDSQKALEDARKTEAKFAREGIKASDQYVAALDRVSAAERTVRDATERVADQRRNLVRMQQDRADAEAAAQTKSKQLTDKLTGAEDRLLKKVKDVKTSLEGAFGPSTTAIVDALTDALDAVPEAVDKIKGSFTTVGVEAGNVIRSIGEQLTSDHTTDAFNTFASGATALMQPVADIVGSLFSILLDIGTSALPYVTDAFGHIAQWFKDLASSPDTLTRIRDAIAEIWPHLETWWGIAKNLGGGFFGLLKDAAGDGKTLADRILDVAENFNEWANSKKGRQDVHDFLKEAIPMAESFVAGVWNLLVAFITFSIAVTPLLTDFFNILRDCAKQIDRMLGAWGKFHQLSGVDLKDFLDPDKIGNVGKVIGDKLGTEIAHALGIGSPSKVTQTIGRETLNGFILGIDDPNKITAAVNRAFKMPILAGTAGLPPSVQDAAGFAGRTTGVNIGEVIMPPPPSGGNPDPQVAARQFMDELKRRGGRGG